MKTKLAILALTGCIGLSGCITDLDEARHRHRNDRDHYVTDVERLCRDRISSDEYLKCRGEDSIEREGDRLPRKSDDKYRKFAAAN